MTTRGLIVRCRAGPATAISNITLYASQQKRSVVKVPCRTHKRQAGGCTFPFPSHKITNAPTDEGYIVYRIHYHVHLQICTLKPPKPRALHDGEQYQDRKSSWRRGSWRHTSWQQSFCLPDVLCSSLHRRLLSDVVHAMYANVSRVGRSLGAIVWPRALSTACCH